MPDCQIGSLILINNETGKVKSVQLECKSWTCEHCGPKKAKVIFARAFAGAIGRKLKGFRDKFSTKLFTLTLGGREFREKYTKAESYKIAKYHFQKLVKNLRHVYGSFEYLAVLELHKDGYIHIHVILRGRNIAPKSVLDDIEYFWRDLYGLGFVRINVVRSLEKALKYVLKYFFKEPPIFHEGERIVPKRNRFYFNSRRALEPPKKREKSWDYVYFTKEKFPAVDVDVTASNWVNVLPDFLRRHVMRFAREKISLVMPDPFWSLFPDYNFSDCPF